MQEAIRKKLSREETQKRIINSLSEKASSRDINKNELTKKQKEINSKDVEVYNASGQRILSETINAEKGSVDMRRAPAGVYILKVNTERGSQSLKIIKK